MRRTPPISDRSPQESTAPRRSAATWQAAFDAISDGVLIADLEGVPLDVNRPFAELWRLPETMARTPGSGELMTFLLYQVKNHEPLVEHLRDARRDPTLEWRGQVELTDGRVLECESRPQRQDGIPVGRVLSCRDFTERKRAEEALRLLQSLILAASDAEDLDAALHATLRLICEATGWPLGQAWIPRADGSVLTCSPAWYGRSFELDEFRRVSEVMVLRPDEDLPGKAWSTGQAQWVPDLEPSPETPRGVMAPEADLWGSLAVPVMSGAEVVAILEFFLAANHEEDAHMASLVTAASHQLGALIQRRRMEEQVRQSQKMEAIGQLAGSMAHDFNNVLTVVYGYSSVLLRQLGDNAAARDSVERIRHATSRAAALTRQLLGFARKQVRQPALLNMNGVLADVDTLLRSVLGDSIELHMRLEPGLASVMADPGQMEQIIMNLSVNARDAMPDGGSLSIETANETLDAAACRSHKHLQPGRYVRLSVTDSGSGMDAATRARVFEPFFTTKDRGRGTGLGLSTVYGIVRDSGGDIWLYSEVGHGTTFKIYLPQAEATAGAFETTTDILDVPGGCETVLVVEDQDPVRDLMKEVLERFGYLVLAARGGGDALRVARAHQGPIDLLLTDVVMPDLNGREVARRLTKEIPRLRVLYTSGYADEHIVRHGILEEGVEFIEKPFTEERLAHKVRRVLDKAT